MKAAKNQTIFPLCKETKKTSFEVFWSYLLSKSRSLVDFASLFLALALEVVMAVTMPLPMKLYVISLRLK